MRKNHVKEMLKRGEPALGAWLNIPSPFSVRTMAQVGFDWLLVDMEHSAQNPVSMAEMVATIADAGTCAPLVRIPTSNVEWFKWALDAGAWGVVVPMINTREEAQNAVSWSKYPPEGTRSVGGVFAPYSFKTDRLSYIEFANEEMLVVVQIESEEALHNLDEILSVPGIDVAFIGPNDLHASLGLIPTTDGTEPAFVEALERVQASARKHHIATGIMTNGGDLSAKRVHEGFQMIAVTTDLTSMLGAATQHLRVARSAGSPG